MTDRARQPTILDHSAGARTPMRGIFCAGCASAPSGAASTAPRPVTNARR